LVIISLHPSSTQVETHIVVALLETLVTPFVALAAAASRSAFEPVAVTADAAVL